LEPAFPWGGEKGRGVERGGDSREGKNRCPFQQNYADNGIRSRGTYPRRRVLMCKLLGGEDFFVPEKVRVRLNYGISWNRQKKIKIQLRQGAREGERWEKVPTGQKSRGFI